MLPEGVRRIEREAFAECRKLLKCNLSNALEYIGEYAFRRCFSLKPFDPWPKHATIHAYAFYLAKQFDGNNVPVKEAPPAPDDEENAEDRIAAYAHARAHLRHHA